MNEIELKKTYWASVSGGKDSLYMLKLILSNPAKYPLDGVVHFELEIDYPFIKNVIDYMERECKTRGITFIRIKPTKTWFELYGKYGFPTRVARWCNSAYKLDALKQLKEFLKERNCEKICYIGYCYDEIKRIENHGTHDIYPLHEEQINESEILEWAKNVPLFNDYYKYNTRCGCMFCPLQTRRNLAYLYKFYPDKFSELMCYAKRTEEIREIEINRPFSVWSSNPKYNTDYVINNVITKHLPKLETEMKGDKYVNQSGGEPMQVQESEVEE